MDGVRRAFDAVALHPYSRTMLDLELQIRRVRAVMDEHGESSVPIHVTELGWASDASSGSPLAEGPRGQADALESAYSLLSEWSRAWGIRSVSWYAIRDTDAPPVGCSFCASAGLLAEDGDRKPAFRVFREFARE